MVDLTAPNSRARRLTEDQRIRLRDLEQTSRLTDMEVGEVHALRMTGNVEEQVRADRVLDRARREAAANRTDQSYTPGFWGARRRRISSSDEQPDR
jgi:hypothetical protein